MIAKMEITIEINAPRWHLKNCAEAMLQLTEHPSSNLEPQICKAQSSGQRRIFKTHIGSETNTKPVCCSQYIRDSCSVENCSSRASSQYRKALLSSHSHQIAWLSRFLRQKLCYAELFAVCTLMYNFHLGFHSAGRSPFHRFPITSKNWLHDFRLMPKQKDLPAGRTELCRLRDRSIGISMPKPASVLP